HYEEQCVKNFSYVLFFTAHRHCGEGSCGEEKKFGASSPIAILVQQHWHKMLNQNHALLF
ncbi:MAG TPA: hypothetical protein VN958_22290, partial [Chitinophagaceae bacterium]|nr:hypothetical protein [Chitinophagaceae bacterium]